MYFIYIERFDLSVFHTFPQLINIEVESYFTLDKALFLSRNNQLRDVLVYFLSH